MVMDMSIFDECDVEYSVSTDLPDSQFYERGNSKSNNTWSLIVSRRVLLSWKTLRALRKHLRALRKHGQTSRWKYYKAIAQFFNFGIGAGIGVLITIVLTTLSTVALLVTGTYPLIAALVALAIFWYGMGITLGVFGKNRPQLSELLKEVLPENAYSRRKIELPWKEQEIYELAKTLSKADSNEDTKKALFDLLSEYPTEANERINELFKMKEEVPENTAESEMVLSEIDGMLDKLFDMRDTPESAKIAEQVKQVLRKQVNSEKMSKIGVSVEKLAEISEFLDNSNEQTVLNVSHNSGDVSVVVNELNNSVPAYETAEKDNPGLKQITWHDA